MPAMSDLFAPLPPACDVVVLGGGASGSSIAYQLAKRGVDVLLLEAYLRGSKCVAPVAYLN